ncbi:MAG: HDOD domain-containing protein [Gammaproteobacteria bacterium (ex Lamellibrachia satsuma)]|nr:MAG: HDOD domain-containing protein [Gammaproteobacteria bacterium (ex Lamellibrachia satsuma)]
MSSVWEEISKSIKLISLPDIYLRLKSVLEDPNYTMESVAWAINHDPAITVRLLRIVNSAYFGLATQIDSVSRAVNLLGAQGVHDLVLAASVAQSFTNISNEVMDMERFWRTSVVCAITSRELASLCSSSDGERLFVCGLLHDIGHLVSHLPDGAWQGAAGEPV